MVSSSNHSNSGRKSHSLGETCDEVVVAPITDAGRDVSEQFDKQRQDPCCQWVWLLDGR